MIISCPNCSAGFFVSPQQIGEAGRRVKCSKCKNVWHATIDENRLPNEEEISQSIKNQKYVSGINLPAIIPIKISNYLYALPPAFFFLIILTLYIFYPSFTSSIGVHGPLQTPKGLRIENIMHDNDRLNNKVTIEYSIANYSNKAQKVPFVQLKLIDENNNVIRTVYADGAGMTLAKNKVVMAKSEFNNVRESAKYVLLSLGSRFKFWVK